MRTPSVITALLLVAVTSARTGAAQHVHTLGAVDFHVSCAEGVRPEFDRAVALLHHMMYVESRAAFEGIAAKDPGCGMSHWGIAMTLFQPLWPTRPDAAALKRGWEEVGKAESSRGLTDRERDLVAATEAFFREPEADWWTRIGRWADGMQRAYDARPDDIETAALYALAHIAKGLVAPDRMAYQARAATVLLRINERAPTHPGGLHYTIHANDVDGRADKSVDLVRSYDDIAPTVPHALHMPTHIFVRLGDWPGVIEWNRKSADAALDFPAGDAISSHYLHAMDYLLYAYLQRGADRKARAVLDEALGRRPHQQDFISAFHLAAMPARYAVERRDWNEAARISPRVPDYLAWDRYWWPEAVALAARGLGLARTGRLEDAARAEARIAELRDVAQRAGERDFRDYIEVDRLTLAAAIAHGRGASDSAVAVLRAAAKLERSVQKHPVTPGAAYPALEALGELLLELKRFPEALTAFESALAAWPGRYNTLLGAARAAAGTDATAKAKGYYAKLIEVAGDADGERAGVTEAREYVARTPPY